MEKYKFIKPKREASKMNWQKAILKKDSNKIEIPILFYVDDQGNKVFDLEEMESDFQNKLKELKR